MSKGWIKLDRSILNHWIRNNDTYFSAWVIMLLTVNWGETKRLIKGTLFEVGIGQSVNTLNEWADILGKNWDKNKVYKFFELLKKDNMIKTQNKQTTLHLTIVNFKRYQTEDNAEETDLEQKEQRGGNAKETPIYNEDKKVKKVKKIKESKEVVSDRNFPDWFDELLKKDFEEYLMIRKQKKYPITDTIIKRIFRKITDYSNENKLFAHDLFENAINGGWQDIYPIKDKNNNVVIPEKPLPEKTPEQIEKQIQSEAEIRKKGMELIKKSIVKTNNNNTENYSNEINSFAENFGR